MPPSKREKDQDGDVLKPFTIISGEPRKIDCYLDDGSLTLFWAKTKDDVLAHLLRTNHSELSSLPLSQHSDYSHTPSPWHLVLCSDQSCPCSKYVMCWECEETKEALPKGGVTIGHEGDKETLTGTEGTYCQCETPKFRSKIQLMQDAIANCEYNSDYCFKLIELAEEEPIESAGGEQSDQESKKKKSSGDFSD